MDTSVPWHDGWRRGLMEHGYRMELNKSSTNDTSERRPRREGKKSVPVNNRWTWALFFGKLEIGNCWKELIFNLAYSFSNSSKHNICQVTFGKLLEMLLKFNKHCSTFVLFDKKFSMLD
jgi:hypothetical protein